MRSWPPLQLILLCLILFASGLGLRDLLKPGLPMDPATPVADPVTLPTGEREIYIEWIATATPFRIAISDQTSSLDVSPSPSSLSDDLTFRTDASARSLKFAVVWPDTTRPPVAIQFRIEPDNLPSQTVDLWLQTGTDLEATFDL